MNDTSNNNKINPDSVVSDKEQMPSPQVGPSNEQPETQLDVVKHEEKPKPEPKKPGVIRKSVKTYMEGSELVERGMDLIGIVGTIKTRAIIGIVCLILSIVAIVFTSIFVPYWETTHFCKITVDNETVEKVQNIKDNVVEDITMITNIKDKIDQKVEGEGGEKPTAGLWDSAKGLAADKIDATKELAKDAVDSAKEYVTDKIDNTKIELLQKFNRSKVKDMPPEELERLNNNLQAVSGAYDDLLNLAPEALECGDADACDVGDLAYNKTTELLNKHISEIASAPESSVQEAGVEKYERLQKDIQNKATNIADKFTIDSLRGVLESVYDFSNKQFDISPEEQKEATTVTRQLVNIISSKDDELSAKEGGLDQIKDDLGDKVEKGIIFITSSVLYFGFSLCNDFIDFIIKTLNKTNGVIDKALPDNDGEDRAYKSWHHSSSHRDSHNTSKLIRKAIF